MTTRKINTNAIKPAVTTYVGRTGELFYDSASSSLRISDGTTAGGIPMSGTTGTVTNPLNANWLPSTDNTYTLGSATRRWKEIFIGPGTLYITDAVLNTTVAISVSNGILKVDGVNQLQVGQLKFIDNTIESTTPATDIQIGYISDTASLVLNRNISLATGKTLTVAGDTSITGSITLTGNFLHNGLDIEQPNYITVTTAGTYAASTTNSKNILLYTGGAVNVTWTMPPNPIDGQVCSWTNSSSSTSVFFITAGPTLVPPISGPYNAGTKFQYVYRASTNKWHDLP